MYKRNLIIAGLIALVLHIALVMAPNVTSEPEVIFKKGESSLKMHLVPSAASTASTKSINDLQEDHKVEEKTVEKPKPLQKTESPKAAVKPIDSVTEDVPKVQEKTLVEPTPLQKSETPEERHVKVENKVVQQEKEITYSTEYFETQKEVNNKQPQMQKNNTATLNSKEVIADFKEKGVTMGSSIKNVFKPSYPSSCKRQGHEGTTVLEVTILSKGKCGNIDIIRSAGCKSLDKAALKALKKAIFIPAKRLGVPFTTTKKIAFNFKLEDYQ